MCTGTRGDAGGASSRWGTAAPRFCSGVRKRFCQAKNDAVETPASAHTCATLRPVAFLLAKSSCQNRRRSAWEIRAMIAAS